ncbi:sarcosine oxidase subunit gamma family protein [Novosphingobium sp.]|uniref:sarcosine oxidase subunit gamma n=1 Tax=Novosphingobium sp. TaxID=1874826 RepID=UPI00334193B6
MADVRVSELAGYGLASVMLRPGVDPAVLGAALGIAVATGPRASMGDGIALWGSGPGQWLAHVDMAAPDWADALGDRLTGVAAVVDQSGAYTLFDLAGTDAAAVLQMGLPVDLSPAALAADAVVVSVIAHIGVIVHRVAPDHFHLAVFRSFTESFREWLNATIAAL